jgi:hypothetical protein
MLLLHTTNKRVALNGGDGDPGGALPGAPLATGDSVRTG